MEDTLLGSRFGRWLVIGSAEKRGKHPYCFCRCDCGTEKEVSVETLKNGISKSCGCYRREVTIKRSTTHGHCKRSGYSREFHSWSNAKARCTREAHIEWKRYGGRGISMCERWLNSFANFLADMGPRPPHTTLERKDNEKDYEPSNCTWAPKLVQANNTRSNAFVIFEGNRLTIAQLARQESVEYQSLWYFYRTKKLPVEQALMLASPLRE